MSPSEVNTKKIPKLIGKTLSITPRLEMDHPTALIRALGNDNRTPRWVSMELEDIRYGGDVFRILSRPENRRALE